MSLFKWHILVLSKGNTPKVSFKNTAQVDELTLLASLCLHL